MADEITRLDATGLRFPLPVLRTRKAMKSVSSGALMEILATDPAAPADFEAFCKETDHSFVSIDEDDGVYRIIVRKKASG